MSEVAMCGVAGWVDWDRDLRDQQQIVESMTSTLIPRGPDSKGMWVSKRAVFGHRRLAVIDLVGGVQPMLASLPGQEECVLSFTGEIYNFVGLRTELETRGHRFCTRSDTEVLLHAYLEWGIKCVERLNGMFAFAIWDPNLQGLLLARDRLGVKPLYYCVSDSGVIFGSEQKALLAHPAVQPEVDAEGLTEMLFLAQTPGHAIFRDIHALRPGFTLWADRGGVRESRYWMLSSAPHTDGPIRTVETVREILADTVASQSVADVPVGTLLSGGLDSSVVTALTGNLKPGSQTKDVRSYAIDFAGNAAHFEPTASRPDLDTPFARIAASHIGSDHTEISLSLEDVLEAQTEVVQARDIPGIADTNAAQYLLFREVKKSVTVALSGEAADEVFGGYPWFHRSYEQTGFPWAVPARSYDALLLPEVVTRIESRDYLGDRYVQAVGEVPRLEGEEHDEARTRELFYLTLTRWLTMLLDFKDRMSMRSGLEVRVPFCDHRLLEYVWNVPWELKTYDGWNKGLLRAAVTDLLPEAILNRRKTSFPINQSPQFDTALRRLLAEEISTPNSSLASIVDRKAVQAALKTGNDDKGMWRSTDTFAYLLQIATWLRIYNVRLV